VTWGAKARAAAAAARKRKSGTHTSMTGHTYNANPKSKGNSRNAANKGFKSGLDSRGYPSKAIGSQSSPVASKPGKPMKAPGVAKPTGPHAFTAHGVQQHLDAGGSYSSYAKVPKKAKFKNGKKIKGKKNLADAIARSNAIVAHGNATIAGKYKRGK
jgi:hypothetical protein